MIVRAFAAAALILWAQGASAKGAPPATDEALQSDVFRSPPAVLFQDYAMAACLGFAIPSVSPQSGAAASGYIQYGDAPIEAYTDASQLAYKFVQRTYQSIIGADLSIMKCLDFQHSPELAALTRRYYPRALLPPVYRGKAPVQ